MQLKVDNLRHIHDHGLAVQFSDPRLVSLVEHLASRDGETTLTAGQSKLTLTKLGNVTFTEAYWCVGGYHRAAAHYFDKAADLKFSLSREGGEAEAEAYKTLRAVILGGELPHIWHPRTGAARDALHQWSQKFAWTLAGAAGLRSQALTQLVTLADGDVRCAQAQLDNAKRNVSRVADSLVPELLAARSQSARNRCNQAIERCDADIAAARERLAEIDYHADMIAEDRLREIARSYGAWQRYDYATHRHFFGWLGSAARMSPPYVSANYSATISAEGKITLSSGIVCPFNLEQLKDWLRSPESRQIGTRYGAVHLVQTTTSNDQDAQPKTLIACGCHRIDPAPFPEIAELCKPTHAVTHIPATPAVALETDRAAFVLRLRAEIDSAIRGHERDRAEAIAQYASVRHEIEDLRTNGDAHIAKAEAAIAEAEAALAQAKELRANVKFPLGAQDSQANVLRAITALSGGFAS